MKIITYNVNGIRSAISKNWLAWLQATDADVVCLQEIKATPDVMTDLHLVEHLGYQHYWYPAEKKGYSGTAIFTKHSPKHVEYGCGISDFDREGRNIRVDFEDISVMSVYFPSGSSGDERQDFKFRFLDEFGEYINQLKWAYPKLVVSGDYNICHRPIDIHNPKSNANSSGFLPAEREWMENFIESGFVDTFRHLNKEPHNYTWWSFRANARAKNLGWRIDYNMATADLEPHIKRAAILSEARHSDHCPVLLELDINV
ncbi:exodeoxyribonuclease III [Mucilaginibacter sp. KACC 22063]|uniref:exodeoxyribonuclease III n=1 Tax=Mucilaginibacter sp. KACC 22063 TaxID=3025666 RepID=UPI002364FED2|nr:exodeoxyribonuclease III [Mucilaginibacter sp. KACC 22063]WDF55361.1 exodeoxyribonuclease III [Mucilaginibacter sp. KACC 22063]